MKLFIPNIGAKLKLLQPWVFPLFFERRNYTLVELLKPGVMKNSWDYSRSDQALQATLPSGTILTVDRMYIRKGSASAFNSVTFIARIPDQKKGIRFWAKLEDVNEIEFGEVTEADLAKPKKRMVKKA